MVQGEFTSRVDLRSLLLHDHVQNAEVQVARVLKKLNDEVFLGKQDVNIELLQLNKLLDCLNV